MKYDELMKMAIDRAINETKTRVEHSTAHSFEGPNVEYFVIQSYEAYDRMTDELKTDQANGLRYFSKHDIVRWSDDYGAIVEVANPDILFGLKCRLWGFERETDAIGFRLTWCA
jgi:hypothetical protein